MAGVIGLAVALGACSESGRDLPFPDRPAEAPGASEIEGELQGLSIELRDRLLFDELARGNTPSWTRSLVPVTIGGEVDGEAASLTFWTTPDYLAVGSDEDHALVPLSSAWARRLGSSVGATLPTPAMVDATWRAADKHFSPIRMGVDENRFTAASVFRHDRLVKSQRRIYGTEGGTFVAGTKIDLVMTPSVLSSTDASAVYGWHRPDGRRIQPLFTSAEDEFVVYNRGIRLVDRRVEVNGETRDLIDLVGDPAYADLLGL